MAAGEQYDLLLRLADEFQARGNIDWDERKGLRRRSIMPVLSRRFQHTGLGVGGILVKPALAAPWVLPARLEAAHFCQPRFVNC